MALGVSLVGNGYLYLKKKNPPAIVNKYYTQDFHYTESNLLDLGFKKGNNSFWIPFSNVYMGE